MAKLKQAFTPSNLGRRLSVKVSIIDYSFVGLNYIIREFNVYMTQGVPPLKNTKYFKAVTVIWTAGIKTCNNCRCRAGKLSCMQKESMYEFNKLSESNHILIIGDVALVVSETYS